MTDFTKDFTKHFAQGAKLTLAALLLLALAFAAGCGGGSSSGGGSAAQAQNFAETVALPGGQAGALSLAVQPGGAATGTLTVAALTTASLRTRTAAKPHSLAPLSPGSYAVTGTLTGSTFTLTGAVSGTAFTLTGSLPAGSTAGAMTLTLGTGATTTVYTGTLTTGGTTPPAAIPFAGTYQGVSLNTSGYDAPGGGVVTLTINPDGTVTGKGSNAVNGASATVSGTIDATGKFTLTQAGNNSIGVTSNGDVDTGILTQNTTTHIFTVVDTKNNAGHITHGVVTLGLAPIATPLAGAYSGAFTASDGSTATGTITITATGVVTGTASNGTTAFSGYVDNSQNIYLSFTSGSVFMNAVGGLSLNGSSLSGTLQQTGSDGSSKTQTAAFTKTTTANTINLAGTTWRVSSYSGAVDISTCPGKATDAYGTVVDCGSNDHTTFNTDGTLVYVGLGGDSQTIYTTTGTWSQNANSVTITYQAETPSDPTSPAQFPVTFSESITVVDATHFTVQLPGAPGDTGIVIAHLTKE